MATLEEISTAMTSVVEAAGKSVVTVHARSHRPASGVVWGDGLVLTSAHVLERDDNLEVDDGNGRKAATLAGHDPASDIALLKVEGLSAPAASRGASSSLSPGSLVLALGRPGELQVSLGTVGSLGAQGGFRGAGLDHLIQTDATLYQGFSGGPLLDAAGKVVGINSWYYGRGTTRALPVEDAARVADLLQQHGRIPQPYLGIGAHPLHLDESSRAGAGQDRGLMIVSVDAKGPAAAAGVKQGDILLAVGEAPTTRLRELMGAMRRVQVGSEVSLRLLRAGTATELKATLAERGEGETEG